MIATIKKIANFKDNLFSLKMRQTSKYDDVDIFSIRICLFQLSFDYRLTYDQNNPKWKTSQVESEK